MTTSIPSSSEPKPSHNDEQPLSKLEEVRMRVNAVAQETATNLGRSFPHLSEQQIKNAARRIYQLAHEFMDQKSEHPMALLASGEVTMFQNSLYIAVLRKLEEQEAEAEAATKNIATTQAETHQKTLDQNL